MADKLETSPGARVRKALIADAPAIQTFVNHFAANGSMLSRPLAEIYEDVRDYFVADDDGHIVGSAALHIFWADLAEIRALAVAESHQRMGLGSRLVEVAIDEARSMGVNRIFALTFETAFFRHCGFKDISKEELPHKIWSDCIRYPMFPNCDEEAVILDVV